jgi:D-sedoheptulose 7-phosphate isomerase
MKLIESLIEKHPDLNACAPMILETYEILRECFSDGGKVLVCGNGGSAADSEHIVSELMKGFMLRRPLPESTRKRLLETCPENGRYLAGHLQGALPAISLVSQTSLITAYANDVAADMIFAQQVSGYGKTGDVVIGLSTSGNSPDVVHALQVGRALGLRTISFTGPGGEAVRPYSDVEIRVPAKEPPAIQEQHESIYHALCGMLEEEFFSQ